jgi:NADPH2:quinone reductase
MKAIVVHEIGGPEVLTLEEVPTPGPMAGQVLVRIRAAGVNPYDTYMRNGVYTIKPPLPYTPGSDGAGDSEDVGEGVNKVKPGDRVYVAKTVTGAYAEYALIQESQVHPLPAEITYAQGAGIWVPYGSAYHALYQCARGRAGEAVLIHGASGGVGVAAVQIARAMGRTVLGTAGTQKGLELVRREGAHHVFDHSHAGYFEQILKATSGLGVNLILEMLANVNLGQDLKLLAPQGRVVVIGSRGDVTISPTRPHDAARLDSRLYAVGRHRGRRKRDSCCTNRRDGEWHPAACRREGVASRRGSSRPQRRFGARCLRQDRSRSVMCDASQCVIEAR